MSFKDCNDTEIVKLEGESNLKEYEAGFKDALRNAFATVPQQQAKMPTYRQEEINQVTIVTKKEIPNPGTELFRKSENPPKTETLVIDSNSQMEEFVHDGTSVYKLTIDANSFVLMDSTKSNILANYYPAAHSGVYHVKVNNGNNPYYTIGYNFNGKLSYEQKSGSNQWTLVEFEKK